MNAALGTVGFSERAGRVSAERISLTDLARQALEDSDGMVEEATAALMAQVLKDRKLLQAVLQDAVETAATTLVTGAMRKDREAIQNSFRSGATKPRIEGATMVAVVAESMIRSLLDYPLAGGVRLRDATRDLVERQAEIHGRLADNNKKKAKWFTAIAAAIPEGARVGDVLTEARVDELYTEAFQ